MRLGADMELNSTRKRDFISSLRRIASVLGASAKAFPADPQYLQQRLKGFAPAAAGLSKKTWSNILSDAKAALTRVGVVQKPASRSALAPQWQALFDQVVDRNMRCNLTRFVTFCSRTGVDPSQVNNDTMNDFMDLFSSLRKDPALAHYYATKSWNSAAMTVEGWPQIRLQVPSRRKIYTASPSDLPRSFNQDVERYFALMAGADVLADEAPPQAAPPGVDQPIPKTDLSFLWRANRRACACGGHHKSARSGSTGPGRYWAASHAQPKWRKKISKHLHDGLHAQEYREALLQA